MSLYAGVVSNNVVPLVGVGGKGCTLIDPWRYLKSQHPKLERYLEDGWPCVRRLSVVNNAVGDQLCCELRTDIMGRDGSVGNRSGKWEGGVDSSKRSTRFSPHSVENETAG